MSLDAFKLPCSLEDVKLGVDGLWDDTEKLSHLLWERELFVSFVELSDEVEHLLWCDLLWSDVCHVGVVIT